MSTTPLRVGLVGATGYTGIELLRLLACHEGLTLARATSRSEAGSTVAALLPHLARTRVGDTAVTAPDVDDLASACDLVFLAVPHGTAMDMASELLARGVKVVDLSADFRLRDPAVYAAWYKLEHRHPKLIPAATYGLVELYRDAIRESLLTANPGCYPTASILGLAPVARAGLVETGDIVIDAKSGTTGAGRGAKVGSLFCEVTDTFKAYNLTKHRHTPEIEQEVGRAAGSPITLSFNTHLLPINRGILATIYTRFAPGGDLAAAHDAFQKAYANERWIRLLPEGQLPETRNVRGTMFCDIGLAADPRTGRLIVLTAIDNLCRGASGQALACANLMLGLPEDAGLLAAPLVP